MERLFGVVRPSISAVTTTASSTQKSPASSMFVKPVEQLVFSQAAKLTAAASGRSRTTQILVIVKPAHNVYKCPELNLHARLDI